jgi:hypothetical protein
MNAWCLESKSERTETCVVRRNGHMPFDQEQLLVVTCIFSPRNGKETLVNCAKATETENFVTYKEPAVASLLEWACLIESFCKGMIVT